MFNRRRFLAVLAATGLVSTGLVAGASVLATPALAEPATSIGYPAGATATRYTGYAFDTCTAPALSSITAWNASPYRAVAVYIGGVNRTCAQPQLTAGWVTEVSRLRWRLVPIHKGLQPPCGGKPTDKKITSAGATTQGTASATDAVAAAKALGILPGSAIYNNIEHYSATDTACRTTVLKFLSAWTKRLHALGYLSGVYANLSSGAPHLSAVYTSTSYARPDALWIARWDGDSALTGWTGIANAKWAVHQRGKQYRGDHLETHGGVTINIDSDRFDAPVATVAAALPATRTYPYQSTAASGLTQRTGPGTSYAAAGSLPNGSLAWVVCQRAGSLVSTTRVWNRLDNGRWVSDYYVANPSNTTYSPPVPRC